jgi:hypothetical protein
MRTCLTAVVSIALFALIVSGVQARPGAAPAEDFVNVEFSGSVTADFERTLYGPGKTPFHVVNHLTYAWRETSVVPISQVVTPVIGEAKDLIVGRGTLTVHDPWDRNECSGPIVEDAYTDNQFAVAESGVRVNRVQGAGAPGVTGVEVTGDMPIDYYDVKGCTGYLEDAMKIGPIQRLTETNRFSCVVEPNGECHKAISRSGSALGGQDETYTYTVAGIFHAWRSTALPEPETPHLSAAKENAAQDFSNIYFGPTWAYCYPRMIRDYPPGVAFGSGGPYVLSFLGAPWVDQICGDLVKRLANDAAIYNDPPRTDYRAVATVREAPAAPLAPAGAKELAAERQVTAVTAAIKTTVDRESGAKKAGNRSAVALQENQLTRLASQLAQAQAAYWSAAAAVAEQLRAHGVSGPISPTVYGKGLVLVNHRLATVGITSAELAEIVPGKPLIPPDVSMALGAPPSALAGSSSGSTTTTSTTATPPPQPGKAPEITSVTFSGSSASPSVVIHGKNFGKKPAPNPAAHPSGQPSGVGRCPVVAGDTGYNYGTSLYLAATAKNWAGGRYRPELGENDCLDLVVTKFTPTEVAFHFGPFYTKFHSNFSLDNGDAAEVSVNGAVKDVHVKYGTTVSN